ncbi:MBL fold metallo-hydrolase [Halocalculus aciditolerans]|uniref:Flavoprotein n=1 Tax=Halocalculus aciditolerans TaxID=1383812 RepID=A0A830FAM6_9EURY|nr:MBL fold metallo-hydrolase [Halocalculus aciditolerans]GGL56099.1 flavoprotein [Halocalculus aciditolerans]
MTSITNLAAGVQAFTSNAFLVEGDRTVLVDAGANFDVVAALRDRFDESIDADALDAVVFTHTHPDHVENLPDVRAAFDVETWGFDPESDYVDHAIADGDTVDLGDDEYVALHTPGHKNDHLVFYAPSAKAAFAGDLVFEGGSFGRTDLDEGDRDRLVESIEYVIETVDADGLDAVYCGHGDAITGTPVDSLRQSLRAAKTF